MAIVLSPDLEQQIEELVRSGRFSSVEECVRTCIGAFKYHEQDQKETLAELQAQGKQIRRLVAEGIGALGQGDYYDYDDDSLAALIDRIKRDARQASTQGGRP
jgi:Arc/MetJ-type ribon-helix-helix transcriptional regulator